VASLLSDGATVPFIARYRKEATGLLDETQITAIRDRLGQLAELDKRREHIIASLSERDLLDPALHKALLGAANLTILEDLYLPHRPKRRTRGMIARKKGLEPLARAIFRQDKTPVQPENFINLGKGVADIDESLAGARDIIAEWLSEDAAARSVLRTLFASKGQITSSVVKKNQEAGAKFQDYFAWQEPAAKAPGHRLLAMWRGEAEKEKADREAIKVFGNYPAEPQPRGVPGLEMPFAGSSATGRRMRVRSRTPRRRAGRPPRMREKYFQSGNA